MANIFQIKRTAIAGRTPNTSSSSNTQYLNIGELALNLTDQKMFTSNGTAYFEIGANVSNLNVTGNVVIGGVATHGNNIIINTSISNVNIGYNLTDSSIAEFAVNSNNFIEVAIYNANTGNNASADFIVNDTTGPAATNPNYIDMGINGSGFNQSAWTINGPSDGYLYTGNTNLSIGTLGANYLNFFTGNTLIQNERMRFAANGFMIIANGTAISVGGSSGTSGQVLTTNGVGVYWSTISGGSGGINTAAQYTFTNTVTFNSILAANGTTGTAGQYLTSNSTGGVYWSTSTGGGGGGGVSISYSTTPPGSPTANTLWFDSTYGALRVYYADSNGQFQWIDASPTTINTGGSNTQILFNDSGFSNGSPLFTFNKSTSAFSVGNTTANAVIGILNYTFASSLLSVSSSANTVGQVSNFNTSTGNNASADFVAYDPLGLNANNFIDMGINGTGFSQSWWTINGKSDGYLYTGNTNLSVGTGAPNTYLNFFVGNTLIQNEVMRFNPNNTMTTNTSITHQKYSGQLFAVQSGFALT